MSAARSVWQSTQGEDMMMRDMGCVCECVNSERVLGQPEPGWAWLGWPVVSGVIGGGAEGPV